MVAPERPVVSNTTPLINLVGVGLLDLLPQIYGSITIAPMVWHEYQAGMRPNDPTLEHLSWVQIVAPAQSTLVLPNHLDSGEAATIQLAYERQARAVLLDEQLARRVARQQGLPLVGTMGVLLVARQLALIHAIRPIIDLMVAQGRHISPMLRAAVLRAAGEEPGGS